jgi:hypothetical protein
MAIECNNCEVSFLGMELDITFPDSYMDALFALQEKMDKKRVTQVYVKLGMPRKPRTTGDQSQSHHLNGHIQQIAQYTGDDFDDVKMEIKRRAISKGYPFRTDSFGNVVPESEANSSTVECGYLIDTAHEVASFLNVKLREE